MGKADAKHFHKLFGVKQARISYQKKDFIDYVLMTLISALVIYFSYGFNHLLTKVGIALCVFMMILFPIRHGFEFRIPLILKRPQDILYMVIYKIQNMKPIHFFAIGLILLENYLIFLTPQFPHKVELMRDISIHLFYLHFILISLYRTVILVAHLYKKELVREILMQSSWKRFISKQPSITLEILHAYFTGILTHMILIVPWYIVINYFNFSIIFLPVICVLNYITNSKFLRIRNSWYYRDHWLGHNSEFEFLYLHGTHHDSIPCGLIGVAGNGHLEGFMRHTLGRPTTFFNPIMTFIFYSLLIRRNIDSHQYISGIFPKTKFYRVDQHSTHHYGRLEPYGFSTKTDVILAHALEKVKKRLRKLPDEIKNSAKLDEQLNGFEWNNSRHQWYLDLVEKYEKSKESH